MCNERSSISKDQIAKKTFFEQSSKELSPNYERRINFRNPFEIY